MHEWLLFDQQQKQCSNSKMKNVHKYMNNTLYFMKNNVW